MHLENKTRNLIIPHLKITAQLLDFAISDLTSEQGFSSIYPLEDLGLADNIVRMSGGFFTGSYIKWRCSRPFIPIDATVNACGVSVFKLRNRYSIQEFEKLTNLVKKKFGKSWNFDQGNHFISFCVDENNCNFLVIHASDNSYKFGEKGLYPYNNTWFESFIKTVIVGDRYLRYIADDVAEKFYTLYKDAEYSNPNRNRNLCLEIFGNDCFDDEIYSPHYGMPNNSAIAIGCQWMNDIKIMLSSPGKNIYIFKSDPKEIYPHGFGMILPDIQSIDYKKGKIFINNNELDGQSSFIKTGKLSNRFENNFIDIEFIRNFLNSKLFKPIIELRQLAAFNRDGFNKYVEFEH